MDVSIFTLCAEIGEAISRELNDHQAQIRALAEKMGALEEGREQNGLLEMLRGFAPDVVAPDFRRKFTQADLDAAVKAERERILLDVGLVAHDGSGRWCRVVSLASVEGIVRGDDGK